MKTSIAFLVLSCLSLSCFAVCPSMDFTGDCRVDLADLALFAEQWLTEGIPDPDIVWISINDPGVSGYEAFNGEMSQYETTNAQYCQYLNAALVSGDITVSGHYAAGTRGSYAGRYYYNLDGSGYTDDGAINGGAARIHWTGSTFTVDDGFENHPVTQVSWYGASAFASYYGWRLPTRGEWWAAADYDGSYIYGCGTSINNSIANYYGSTHPDGTTPAGTFGSYGYGMADMAGNVWEWTNSPVVMFDSFMIIGGGWLHSSDFCRVNGGSWMGPGDMVFLLGFRVCR